MGSGVKRVSIENANHYLWGKDYDGWHFLDRDDMSAIQERMPPRTSERMHLHKLSRQFFYVLDGTATMDLDGEEIVFGRHQGIEVPPGALHQLRNESPEDLSFLVFSVPKSHNDRYEH